MILCVNKLNLEPCWPYLNVLELHGDTQTWKWVFSSDSAEDSKRKYPLFVSSQQLYTDSWWPEPHALNEDSSSISHLLWDIWLLESGCWYCIPLLPSSFKFTLVSHFTVCLFLFFFTRHRFWTCAMSWWSCLGGTEVFCWVLTASNTSTTVQETSW